MKAACKSDTGKKRPSNEDSVWMDVDRGIFILADGMGGHQAGEVASELAILEAYQFLSGKVSATSGSDGFEGFLRQACIAAHDSVKDVARSDKAYRGMGTTLVLMLIEREKAYICSVGDSRAYLMRESLIQLTKDQTVGAFLLYHNLMPEDEIDPSHFHVLIQAVGGTEELEPELVELSLKKGDLLLLCSDGLTDMLSDNEIKKILAKRNGDLDHLADSLVNEANNKGGYDNISVMIVKLD